MKYWGVSPRKTYNWSPPQCQTLNEIQGFILGLIDGDGTVAYKSKYPIVYLAVSGFTPQLMDWIRAKLLILGYQGKFCTYKAKTSNAYKFYVALNTAETYNLIWVLEPWKYPCLARKWEKAIDWYQQKAHNTK